MGHSWPGYYMPLRFKPGIIGLCTVVALHLWMMMVVDGDSVVAFFQWVVVFGVMWISLPAFFGPIDAFSPPLDALWRQSNRFWHRKHRGRKRTCTLPTKCAFRFCCRCLGVATEGEGSSNQKEIYESCCLSTFPTPGQLFDRLAL